jgi:tetratricopeptide (TPR) repeat protein
LGKPKRKTSGEPVSRERSPTNKEGVQTSKVALAALALVTIIVYARVFGAGFVEYDDDIHVYANPFLNPLSFESVGKFWQHAYQGLYIPLAYTILAGLALFARVPAEMVSSIGRAVTLSPGPFHTASVGFHVANVLLCYLLALQLTRHRTAALLCALVFALHPLQVESVAWISELRGLSGAFFALAALNVFVMSRNMRDRTAVSRELLTASAMLAIFSMLCKPAAVVLPFVALIIDRVALGTAWRRSALTALTGLVCILPFAFITRSVQTLFPAGASLWWQRQFVAGDALTFYIFKILLPINLGVEYGRTPHSVMSHGWSYLLWLLPVVMLAVCFKYRRRRPLAWLGSLIFVTFLLPTLGLVPFTFQVHSTVADRYAYLSMIGLGLVVADVVTAVESNIAIRAASAVLIVLAVLSFNQSGYWADNAAFLQHTIEVNPDVAFAHNNIGSILLTQKRPDEAIGHFNRALELEPRNAMAENNLGLALVQLGRLDEAEPHFRKAVELNPAYYKAYESLGAVYLQTNRMDPAIASLKAALDIQPTEARALNDLGIAFMRSGRPEDGLESFRRAVAAEPSNTQYRRNLAQALLELGRADEARTYLGE